MALIERNLPLTKSRSRSSVTNKKLTLSTTTSDLKSVKNFSNENQIPSQPMIKEPVLMQPKRTLSKCNTKTSFYMVVGMVLKCIKKVCEQSSSELIESKYISSLNPGSSVTFTQVYV